MFVEAAVYSSRLWVLHEWRAECIVLCSQEDVFNYIHNILSIPGHSAEEKQSVWQKAMDHMEVLTPNP